MDIWDEQIINDIKKGNVNAFERCYRLLSPQIYTVIYRICQNDASAQELLQDTFIDVFEKIHNYNHKSHFIAWVKRIAFNNTLNFIKRYNRIELVDVIPEQSHEVECSYADKIADSQLIESLFLKLSEVERLILWLFVVEQYSHEEIAHLTSKTPSYSKSIVSRALKRIRVSKEVKEHAYQ